MVRVQAETEAAWGAAFCFKEGDIITTWAFSVQKVSWCATGSGRSLSSTHLMPAWWCSSHRRRGSETLSSHRLNSQTPSLSVCMARISSRCVLCVISTPPTSGTGTVL